MQVLFEYLTTPTFAQDEALILMDAMAKGMLVLPAAWIATLLLRRSPSGIRHRVWILSFTALLLLPALSLISPAWELAVIDSEMLTRDSQISGVNRPSIVSDEITNRSDIDATASSTALGETISHKDSIKQTAAVNGPSVQPAQPSSTNWKQYLIVTLFCIWLAGFVLLMARLMVRLVSVRWMAKRGVPVDSDDWDEIASRVAREHKLYKRISIRISERAPVPMIWGVFRPVIFLPDDAEDWSPERREMVIQHEFAHIKRSDHISILLVHIVCALYWINPLVWTAARRIEAEREQSTDDAVLLTGARASDYARQLLAIASRLNRQSRFHGHLAMAKTSDIEGRLRAILDPYRNRGDVTAMKKLLTLAFIIIVSLPLTAVRIRAGSLPSQDSVAGIITTSHRAATEDPAPVEDPEPMSQQESTQRDSSPALEAAQALESFGDRDLNAIARALRERNWNGRKSTIGPSQITDRRAVQPLINALRDSDPVARRIAAWALGEIRDPRAVQSLRQTLGNSDADVRAQAAQSLGDIADRQPVEDLILALRDTSPQVRLKAARALGDIQDRSALPALKIALNDPDKNVRDKVAWAIKEIVEDSISDSSVDYLNDSNPLIRERAAHEMGDRKDPQAVASLVEMLWDDSPKVRNKAAWALGEIQSSEAVGSLIRKALEEEEDIAIRRQAIRGLGEIGDPAAGPTLLQLLNSADWRLRSQAADALGDVRLKEAITPLTRALDDDSESVRENARKALRKMR